MPKRPLNFDNGSILMLRGVAEYLLYTMVWLNLLIASRRRILFEPRASGTTTTSQQANKPSRHIDSTKPNQSNADLELWASQPRTNCNRRAQQMACLWAGQGGDSSSSSMNVVQSRTLWVRYDDGSEMLY